MCQVGVANVFFFIVKETAVQWVADSVYPTSLALSLSPLFFWPGPLSSGLPPDISAEEFAELMSKCGIVMRDPITEEYKVKLYKDKEGNLKGDGLCCYLKVGLSSCLPKASFIVWRKICHLPIRADKHVWTHRCMQTPSVVWTEPLIFGLQYICSLTQSLHLHAFD